MEGSILNELNKTDYYNHVIKIWNTVYKDIHFDTIPNPISFKCLFERRYSSIVGASYDVEMACTWSFVHVNISKHSAHFN